MFVIWHNCQRNRRIVSPEIYKYSNNNNTQNKTNKFWVEFQHKPNDEKTKSRINFHKMSTNQHY